MPSSATQRSLLGPQQEAAAYHDAKDFGYFSLLVANPHNGRKEQSSYLLAKMPQVIEAVDPSRDTWISQAEFNCPNRRVVNLLRVSLLFVDLDTYKMTAGDDRSPDCLAASVRFFCAEEGIPMPSILVFSGRGIQAKWLLERAIPRDALIRWNACQSRLIERLAPLGADSGAKDASRVLRLIETVNSKSQHRCRVVHVEPGPDGHPLRYNFEHLALELLPVERQVLEQVRKERAARKQMRIMQPSKRFHLYGSSDRQLPWHRLEDLRRLAYRRRGVHEGLRMRHLFWSLNFLVLSGAVSSRTMYLEAAVIAREIDPRWGDHSSELSTLYNKAKAFEAGKSVSYNGREYPALYTPRNDTLINMFEITSDEQRGLQTIISKPLALERDRKRDEIRRRAAGAKERSAYLQNVDGKRVQARSFHQQGLSIRTIAERLNISKSAVGRYLINI
ncbi:MAG: replication protein [Deltaproteobacteria bacterium]|nr:MAG: replication protein [Deltaproteobacteria bacterium]